MNYKNKLMGLSLIIVAMFSACSDEVENAGRDSGTGDHRITFAVSTQNQPNGTRSAFTSETHELGSVKMEGKLDGKPVYLTAEISDGFPGDDQPLTRGTQVTGVAQVDEFSVSAAILDANVFEPETLDVMYNVKVAKDNASSTWTTGTPYYWQETDFFRLVSLQLEEPDHPERQQCQGYKAVLRDTRTGSRPRGLYDGQQL